MTTYAKIENNTVTEYPLWEGQLQDRFPDIKFPMDTYNTPIPDGYVVVIPTQIANPKTSCRYGEGIPIDISGVWTQQWTEIPYTTEELTARELSEAILIRAERNKRLSATDWTQFPDVVLPDAKRAEILTYRQALRDITTQLNFPFDMVWPVSPI